MENDGNTLLNESSIVATTKSRKQRQRQQQQTGGSSEKRPKANHACDYCKKKKLKCNGENPCARCQKLSIVCTYLKPYTSSVEQRLRALEKVVDFLSAEPIVDQRCRQQVNNIPIPLLKPIEKFSCSSIGQPYYTNDWNARLDRIPATFDKMTTLDNEPRKPDAAILPDTFINPHLLSVYFTHVHPYFPMIHRESFLLHLSDTSPLLLKAMYAVAEQWVDMDRVSTLISDSPLSTDQVSPGFKYYKDAISLVELYTDAPRLSTIQALLLIIKYQELVQRPGFFFRTRLYFDLVVRMCKDLGLSRPLSPNCQVHPILAEQRRRIFWTAYIYDLLMSTEHGTPVNFPVDESTVELPNLLDDEKNSKEQHDTTLYFHWMILVMKGQGAVLQYLQRKYNGRSSQQHQQSMDDHLQQLQQHMKSLGTELQLWKEPARGRVNFLFLAYHFSNILLYRSIALDLIYNNDSNVNGNIIPVSKKEILKMDKDHVKEVLLQEANAIVNIVEMLLRDHTVACLHYSFRGIQQIIHYLTASWTVQLMYQQTNDNKVKKMIQQLITRTPAIELHITENASLLKADSTLMKSTGSEIRSSSGKAKQRVERQDQPPRFQQKSSQPTSSPFSSSSVSLEQLDPSSSIPIDPNKIQTFGYAPPTSLPTQFLFQQPGNLHQTNHLNLDSSSQLQYVPPSTSSPIPSSHIRHTIRPSLILDTTMPSTIYQSSSDTSPMIPTPPLGSSSSASSLSTNASIIADTSSPGGAQRSLRLRRSHQQLRNTSHHRLSLSGSNTMDARSSGLSLHHPYMTSSHSPSSTTSSSTNATTTLRQTHRRHTVSSRPSSPSSLSLPSSPLHRMTLSDDPWIQSPPIIIPSDQSSSPSYYCSSSLSPHSVTAPPSSINEQQQQQQQQQQNHPFYQHQEQQEIYGMTTLEVSCLPGASLGLSMDEHSTMDLLSNQTSMMGTLWDQVPTTTSSAIYSPSTIFPSQLYQDQP